MTVNTSPRLRICLVLLQVPVEMEGADIRTVKDMLANPQSRVFDIVAAQVHKALNTPDATLATIIDAFRIETAVDAEEEASTLVLYKRHIQAAAEATIAQLQALRDEMRTAEVAVEKTAPSKILLMEGHV